MYIQYLDRSYLFYSSIILITLTIGTLIIRIIRMQFWL